jgi:predicted nucleotidyltransferase
VGYQNLRFYGELKTVLRSFENLGIEVIILKGAALAEIVWKNVALRQMGDIDLLVREHDLERVDEMFSELGYISYEGYKSKDWYRRNHHHLAPYNNPEKGVVIEIHYNIVRPSKLFGIDTHMVWERAQAIRIEGVETKILSPEDLIIHLCLHLSYCDLFIGKIRDIIDLSQAIRYYNGGINWDWIIKEANEKKFTKFIYYPLYLATGILNAGIEKEIIDSFKDNSNLRLLEDGLLKLIIRKNIFSKDKEVSVLPTWILANLCSDLLYNDHTHQRIKSLFQTLFLPPHESITKISSPLSARISYFFYPFLRFIQVLSKSSGIVMKALFHKAGINFAD